MGWAAIALIVRTTALKTVSPRCSFVATRGLGADPAAGGRLLRPVPARPAPIHWAGLGFQIVAVVSAGFLFWFWLLKIYPASSVAAFAFLSPIFGVSLGWLMLGEPVGPGILVALVLVCAGLVLINRPAPKPA
jgi:drug/metabolite transporter (DMT)-like permease